MIFISYSREDMAWGALIARALRTHGLTVTRDPALVQGDPFWRAGVRRSLERSQFMIVLWSCHAARSPWVEQEVRNFNGRKHFFLFDQTPLAEGARLEDRTTGCYDKLALTHITAQEKIIISILNGLWESNGSHAVQSSHPDSVSECWREDLLDCDADEVARLREECFIAEEARLERFNRDLGGRKAIIIRLDNRTLLHNDGTRLIRLEGAGSKNSESRDEVYVAATPVTNDQYRHFLEATGYPPSSTWHQAKFRTPELPVVGVTWFEAKAYAAWMGGDLPTQMEWEWAATGGDPSVEYATWNGKLADGGAHFGIRLGEGSPRSNLAYPANQLGFYGMCGNTWDWCSTWDGPHRVICGGGYMDMAQFCKARAVYRNAPIDRDCCVGFRIKVVIRPTTRGERE